MCVGFSKASNRRTESYELRIGHYDFLISYETIVAVRCMEGHYKLKNIWGPTTGRHINEYGGRDWPVISHEEMHGFVNRAIVETAGDLVQERIGGTK
jgi:hypothetical protein